MQLQGVLNSFGPVVLMPVIYRQRPDAAADHGSDVEQSARSGKAARTGQTARLSARGELL